MSGPPPRLTVVVMAYDEVLNLEPTALEIHGVLEALGVPFEILVVDDGSRDGTGALADELARRLAGVRVHHHERNLGLGGVYRSGFREARGELLTFFPADGQFPASILEDFLPRLKDADVVLGYLPGRRPGLLGPVLSAAEKLFYRLLLGPMPRFQGVFMMRRPLLETVTLRSDGRGWAVVMELILRLHRGGCRMVSVPTGVRPRRTGVSKVQNVRTIVANLRQALALRRQL